MKRMPPVLEVSQTDKTKIYDNGVVQYVTKFIVRLDDKTDSHVDVDMVSFAENVDYAMSEIVECAYIKHNERWN